VRPGGIGGAVAGTDRLYRAAAVLALAGAVAALVVMCAAVRVHPWSMAGILVALPAAVIAGWHVVSRRGLQRVVAGLVVLVAVVAPVLQVLAHRPGALLVTMLLFGFSMASARFALRPVGRRPRRGRHRSGARTARAGRAVLLLNPRSGSGRAAQIGLGDLARLPDLDVVRVGPGEDLASLAEAAVAGGARLVGVAGGDGSMASVMGVAARHGVPFVCVPAGTRNHLALDLGLDPQDMAHAVTAFHSGTDVRVDVAEVNGRVFVNNVSLGVYAALLRSRHYRHSKVRAVLDQLPGVIGPESEPLPLRFRAPDGRPYSGAHALLVSNNPYRLGGLGHSAWRPQLNTGSLGVLSIRADGGRAVARLAALELFGRGHLSSGYHRWTTQALTVQADGPLIAALDGESVTLEPPLRFTSRPGALLVRLPSSRPRTSARTLIRESRHLIGTARGQRRRPEQGPAA
jgi:diacylglycerol kinase family enzyme